MKPIELHNGAAQLYRANCLAVLPTLVAAIETGRRAIGIEVNRGYFEIARQRIAGAHPPLFTTQAGTQEAFL